MKLGRVPGNGLLFAVLIVVGVGASYVGGRILTMREPLVDFDAGVKNRDADKPGAAGESPLRFAVATIEGPKTTFVTYRRLVQKVCRKVGRPEKFMMFSSYGEVREALERGELDVAFVCTGTYVHALAGGKLQLLVQPEYEAGLDYRCLILVPAGSEARELRDLRGKTMAFTDRESNTGCLVPCAQLRKEGLGDKSFLGKVVFTGGHDRSIQAVARESVDAAAVDSLVWEANLLRTPSLKSRARVLWSSGAFGPPPVVVPSGLDGALRTALRDAFLALDKEPEDRQMLSTLGLRRFVPPKEEDYRTAVALYEEVRAHGGCPWP